MKSDDRSYAEKHRKQFPYQQLQPGEDPYAGRPHFPKQHPTADQVDHGQPIEPKY